MPHPSFVAGQTLPASDLNLLVVRSTYTPELTAPTTDPNLGTFATQEGQLWVTGSLVWVEFHIVFGTGSSPGSGSPYAISVPAGYPIDAFSGRTGLGTVNLRDDNTGSRANRFIVRHSTDNTKIEMEAEGGGFTDGLSPWGWDDGDSMRGSFTYLTAE